MRVVVDLTKAPRLGKDVVKLKTSDADRVLQATFLLQSDQARRLFQALDNRGLVRASPELPPSSSNLTESQSDLVSRTSKPLVPKSSLAVEAANLEIDSAGQLVEPSQSEVRDSLTP